MSKMNQTAPEVVAAMTDIKDGVELPWRVPEWFSDLSIQILDSLRAYYSELIFFNKKMNLVSPRTEEDGDLIHVADGILAAKLILGHSKHGEIYDIGSGNGVPGLIMAILAPDRTFRLVDSDTRKIEFIKHCINKLGLKNCFATHARAEELGEGIMHCGVCRGFAPIGRALLMLRKVADKGCEFYHMKGETWAREVGQLPAQVLASWEPKFLGDYELPKGGAKLSVILTVRK